jgi:ribosome maturation factor RimP
VWVFSVLWRRRLEERVGLVDTQIMTQSELWNAVESIVKGEGLELFDLEVPSGRSGVLRVFISRPSTQESAADATTASSAGVQHHHCVSVSKKILDLPNIEDILPGEHLIEVSSPGVNRKLSRPEHYRGAVGERVRLKFRNEDGKHLVVFGKLIACEGGNVSVEDEETQAQRNVPLSDVQQARVDFLFE